MIRNTLMCVAVTALLTLLTAPTSTAAPDAGPPSFTHPAHLETVLLGAQQVARIVGVQDGMRMVATATTLTESDPRITPAECVGAFEPGHRRAYARAEPNDVVIAIAADGRPGKPVRFVNQTVVRVAGSEAATDLIRAATAEWERCSRQPVLNTPKPGRVDEWTFGAAELRDDTLVQQQRSERATCERAMTPAADRRAAIIVDVMVCDKSGDDPRGPAERVAATIAHNVRQAG